MISEGSNVRECQVLVVDPNPVCAEIVCSCVSRLGMLAHVEKTAEAALQVRPANMLSLVVLDGRRAE